MSPATHFFERISEVANTTVLLPLFELHLCRSKEIRASAFASESDPFFERMSQVANTGNFGHLRCEQGSFMVRYEMFGIL